MPKGIKMSKSSKESCTRTHSTKKRILTSCSNAQVDFYHEDTLINSSCSREDLSLVELQGWNEQKLSTYLEIKGVKYVIVPGVTSCFKLNEKTFVLSNLNADEGCNAKITFHGHARNVTCKKFFKIVTDITDQPQETGSRQVQKREYETFHDNYEYEDDEEEEFGNRHFQRRDFYPRGEKLRTETYNTFPTPEEISEGIVHCAKAASSAMDIITPEVIEKITPQSKPMDPFVQYGLSMARYAAEEAAIAAAKTRMKGSQFAALASLAGQVLAPGIQSIGTEVLTSNYKYSPQEAEETVKNALDFTADVAQGVTSLCGGFLRAVEIVSKSFAENTTKVVEHTYGQYSGEAVNDAVHIVGKDGSTRLRNKRIETKAVAVEAAKMSPYQK